MDPDNAQGRSLGVLVLTAFSKDILKTKEHFHSTSAMYSIQEKNDGDIFPGVVSSYSEMQWRRQVTLSFTYRSTKQKTKRTT
jgi:hypothetical protein